MMASCDMVIITLKGGLVGGQLVCVISPTPRECNPNKGYLEDPDDGRPVHIQECFAASFRHHRENTI